MGLFDSFRVSSTLAAMEADLKASVKPFVYPSLGNYLGQLTTVPVTRAEAMSVPTVVRARSAIVNTLSPLPLELWSSSGQRLAAPAWCIQPDPLTTRTYTMAMTIDDLIFYGMAIWEVIEVFASDNRPARFRRIDPTRVTWELNASMTAITQWLIDGNPAPPTGVGSIVQFAGTSEGALNYAGLTIRTAAALERAAFNYATDPMPSGVLKNTGFDLDEEQIQNLLQNWRSARQSKATAYLANNLDYQTISFDPQKLQLNEARNYMATELSRLMNVDAYITDAPSGESMSYNNQQDRRRDFVNTTLAGYVSVIEHTLSMESITPRGQYIKFGLDDYLRLNPNEHADYLIKLVTAGLMTVNEARSELDSVSGGME
jgi:HK97 family phage portal protein